MAKKDFKPSLDETSNLEDVTKSYFSEETLKKAEQEKETLKEDVSRSKRKHTKPIKLKSFEKKEKVITFRVTDKEYKELIKKAEQTNSKSVSDYLSKLIRG